MFDEHATLVLFNCGLLSKVHRPDECLDRSSMHALPSTVYDGELSKEYDKDCRDGDAASPMPKFDLLLSGVSFEETRILLAYFLLCRVRLSSCSHLKSDPFLPIGERTVSYWADEPWCHKGQWRARVRERVRCRCREKKVWPFPRTLTERNKEISNAVDRIDLLESMCRENGFRTIHCSFRRHIGGASYLYQIGSIAGIVSRESCRTGRRRKIVNSLLVYYLQCLMRFQSFSLVLVRA
jgi:hypothetical protein